MFFTAKLQVLFVSTRKMGSSLDAFMQELCLSLVSLSIFWSKVDQEQGK